MSTDSPENQGSSPNRGTIRKLISKFGGGSLPKEPQAKGVTQEINQFVDNEKKIEEGDTTTGMSAERVLPDEDKLPTRRTTQEIKDFSGPQKQKKPPGEELQ